MEITPQLVRELLHYDHETGVFTWYSREARLFATRQAGLAWNTKYAGKRAGKISHIKKLRYKCRRIGLFGKYHLEHRLAWMIMTGEHPPKSIDHINGDGTDNRWRNLRNGEDINCRNKKMYRNNTSGATGVIRDNSGVKWRAQVRLNRKYYNLGTFESKTDAEAAVRRKRLELGFCGRHGARQT